MYMSGTLGLGEGVGEEGCDRKKIVQLKNWKGVFIINILRVG